MEGTTNGVNWVRGDWDTSPVFYEYEGESRTLGEWAKVKGVPVNTLKTRIKRGWDITKALETRVRTHKYCMEIEYRGDTKTLSSWAESVGLRPSTLYDRIYKGWSTEKALMTPARKEKLFGNVLFSHEGKSQTLKEWADEKNIGYETLRRRVREYKWSMERALNTKTKVGVNVFTAFGETRSLPEWSVVTGFAEPTLRYRLKAGWSLEDALTQPLSDNTKKWDSNTHKERYNRNTSWDYRVQQLCSSARRRRSDNFSITPQSLYASLLKNGFACAVTGIPLELIPEGEDPHTFSETHPWSPSIDRVDSAKGYTLENTQIVCFMYNTAKNKFDSVDVERMAKALVACSA